MGKNHKRIKGGMLLLVVLLGALTLRLFYIQVICHEEFAETAQLQYEINVDGIDTRGQIFDRNLEPVTGRKCSYYYIMKASDVCPESDKLLEKINAEKISIKGQKYKVYKTGTYDGQTNLRLKEKYGCYVFCSQERYDDKQVACHLTGYLNESEKKGVSGLEYMYEEQLAASGSRLVLMADASGNILPGIAPSVKTGDKQAPSDNSLITTIDINLQQKCESLLQGSSACVVSHAASGEILAMASSPGFNPGNIAEYLTGESDCLINKALQSSYAPGSVFKLVVAAAALESPDGAAARTFSCTGQAAVGGVSVSCATAPAGGHGMIDIYEAMAKSCNCYFAQLGEYLGYEKILIMARRLGLGETVLEQFPEETGGNIPSAAETGAWDISNISIGQGTIQTTPLQITRMVSIIANGGYYVPFKIKKETSVISSAITEVSYSFSAGSQVISPVTASELEEMMQAVMTYGTCSSRDWTVPVWGKSGTAEASLRGRPVKNCWLTGFCDIEGERYVITVFVEDGISGSASALPVFAAVTEYLENSRFILHQDRP